MANIGKPVKEIQVDEEPLVPEVPRPEHEPERQTVPSSPKQEPVLVP